MKFVLGLIIGLLIVPISVFFYLRSGKAPVAAIDNPLPLEKRIAAFALNAKIQAEAPKRDISTFTTADLEKGADIYKKDCAFCHTLPGQGETPAAKGMSPDPPELFTPMDEVTDDPVGVTYWKIKNGIRLSGMPAFKDSLSDGEIWDVAALMARVDNLPQSVTDRLKPTPENPPSTGTADSPEGSPAKPIESKKKATKK